jgi:2-oxoglutarate dehydrogenase E1 component
LAELKPSKLEQSKTLSRLTNAHAFNEFLKTKFPTSKRFGVEGNDTLISGLGALVD